MDTPFGEHNSSAEFGIPERIYSIRDAVFARWRHCVNIAIPETKDLEEKTFSLALRRLFEELILALRNNTPYLVSDPRTSPSALHGRQRASLNEYGHKELLHELQLFRQTLFEVADAHSIPLAQQHRSILARSIDNATRDAVNSFAVAQKEVGETFITSLSHDLRNPLHIASASIQLIQHKSHDQDILKLAQRIRRKLADIDDMVETLLDAASLKGRKKIRLHIVPLNMKSLADEVCSDMSSPERPIVCSGDSVEGYWCATSIRRVYENLLSNALKYGKPGSLISVHIQSIDGFVQILVHNEGTPIPETDQRLLFSTYHRFEDVTVTGWGLGLPFVRLVAESHGGAVTVKSTPQDGTTFSITMLIDCRPFDSSSKSARAIE